MSVENPASPDPDRPENSARDVSAAVVQEEAATQDQGWRKLRLFALGGLTLVGSSVLCLGMLTGSAAWYTSRSQFCSSCHIMEPYYASWQHSTHSDVACIKCHFAPGIGEKIRGKMQGLVQLCTYITRSEGPRPVAEVSDASCLRSGCHETRSLPGPLEFHGIVFDHGPHLQELDLAGATRDPTATLEVSLDGAAPEDAHHGIQLRCTSCHEQIDQTQHMSVSTSTCFLCHFKQGLFNQGVGACTRCHQIPEERFELGGGITFTHELVYENGIDCQSCHGDINRGHGSVARVRCNVCHNREVDVEKIVDAELMHRLHVTEHKVDCTDCHEQITHALATEELTHAASDCASCHPDHHREQVNMLMGMGGVSIPEQAATMTASRVQCIACHRERQVSATGTVVWKASADVCTACHSTAAADKLQQYQEDVRESLADLNLALGRARETLGVAEVSVEQLTDLKTRMDKLEHDLEFLTVGNGIHNIHYASSLTRALFDGTTEVCRELGVPEPTTRLPEGAYQLNE